MILPPEAWMDLRRFKPLRDTGMTMELRVGPETVAIHAIGADPRQLTEHRQARHRGDDQIDPGHWDGLPDGHTRAITLTDPDSATGESSADRLEPVALLLDRPGIAVAVARRDPQVYDAAAGLTSAAGGAA